MQATVPLLHKGSGPIPWGAPVSQGTTGKAAWSSNGRDNCKKTVHGSSPVREGIVRLMLKRG